MSEEIVYSIRCFRNQRRRPTHELSDEEAYAFRNAALYLASYLTHKYGLPNTTVGMVRVNRDEDSDE